MAFCSKCGTAMAIGAGFCASCGAPTLQSASGQPAAQTSTIQQRPDDLAKMSQVTPSSATTVCSWCSKEITGRALKCPNYGKWRTDISSERVIYYSFLGASTFSIFILWRQEPSSAGEFFSSGWFWLSVFAFAPAWYYYARLSKKMGTWCRALSGVGRFRNPHARLLDLFT